MADQKNQSFTQKKTKEKSFSFSFLYAAWQQGQRLSGPECDVTRSGRKGRKKNCAEAVDLARDGSNRQLARWWAGVGGSREVPLHSSSPIYWPSFFVTISFF
jgi:hypothetical protein